MLQVDHTPVDVIVVDEEDRLPIGRPWLTLAIDVASRVVAGFTVSLEAPSTVSVALALTHAVLPKETWLADRDLDVEWPVAGIPVCVHVDNAPEFESAAIVRGTQEYGIELVHRPVRRPAFGGHIERLIGTMMGAAHLLPVTTFSSVAEKGDYPSEDRAALTLAELERWLALEIAGYHQRVHTVLRQPPMHVWKEALARRAIPRATHPIRSSFSSISCRPCGDKCVGTAFDSSRFSTGTTFSVRSRVAQRSPGTSATIRAISPGSFSRTNTAPPGPFRTLISGGPQSASGSSARGARASPPRVGGPSIPTR